MRLTDIEEKVQTFEENHPLLFWLLARFILVTCISLACIAGFLGFCILLYPLVALESGEANFACWLLVPVVCTLIWAIISAISFIVENFI